MAKVNVDFGDAKEDIKKFKLKAKGRVAKSLEKEIVKSIERGVSPVKGKIRFPNYSRSYQKEIRAGRVDGKRARPVNLKVTGELLKSIFFKITKKGVLIGFDNFLADIHNRRGAGKSKVVRRMLPTNQGEEFSRSITLRMREVLNKLAKQIFKK